MDTELFELCKEVYKRTEWDKTETDDGYDWNQRYVFEDYPENGRRGTVSRDDAAAYHQHKHFVVAPLYTSDYLLEKLPAKVRSMNIEIIKRHDDTWYAGYSYGHDVDDDNAEIFIHAEASTLLYTSLKLTIALDDAKELSK